MNLLTKEEAVSQCKGRQFVLLVDESASMQTADCPDGATRWAFVEEVIGLVASKANEFDPDGIDVCFFGGNNPTLHEGVTPEKVSSIMPKSASAMSTKTGLALDKEFKRFFGSGNVQPTTFIVLTDGMASDRPMVENALKNAAKAAFDTGDSSVLGVGMWQIGRDPGAWSDLQHYDDGLGEVDVVDATALDDVLANLGDIEVLMAAAHLD